MTHQSTPKLYAGYQIGSFVLVKRIDSLDELWEAMNRDKSIFARRRIYPTAFMMSWQIRSIRAWMDKGYFWTIKQIDD